MTETIKIFGERNTSTNAVKQLIETNSGSRVAPSAPGELAPRIMAGIRLARRAGLPDPLRERIVDLIFQGRPALEAWKHATTNFDEIGSLSRHSVIFCVRHPASWVLGLFRRPYHVPGPFSESLATFLDRRWPTVGRERLGRTEMSALEIYNAKMLAFAVIQTRMKQAGMHYSIVRHEDFASDQEGVFTRLAPFLEAPSDRFCPLDVSTKDREKTLEYYKDYYGNQRWLDEIDAGSAARIKDGIDWSVLVQYGYQPH